MKKLLLPSFLILFFTFANAQAKINAVVTITPQKIFLEKIAKDKVNISLMIKQGDSPHTYEPKPSQMKDIQIADVYFTIGVEFEHIWLQKFQNQNPKMSIVHMDKNIQKLTIEKHSHHDEHNTHNKHKNEHDDESLDPHIWTSPINVKKIALNIYNSLVKIDNQNKDFYKKNLDIFLSEIENTDITIKDLLKTTPKHTKFMVFHPSWGYFAKEYSLEQFAIESNGKNPKPKQLAFLITEAKEENVKAIFAAPEFSTKAANQIANEVGVPVIKVSPLASNWSENLINLAKAICIK